MVHESANTDGDLPNSMEGAHAARASRVSVRCDRARVCGCARAACRGGEADGASGPRRALYELISCVVQYKSLVNLKAAFKLMRHSSYLLAQARHLLLDHFELFILLLPLQVELAQLRAKRHPHVVK